jgi:class 3 adenylate cyclase/tetratricopeptide (TPR) repeat protein
MTCPRCRQECPPDFAFCPRCGAALQSVSSGSHASAVSERRPLPQQSATQHERRMITILFCDVVGSTAMAEHLDPEEFLEIMNGAFETLIPHVIQHEGTVSRLMGDAVLALFGTPVAHEDDPERAVRAALEMAEAARLYGAHLARKRGIEGFAVRAGINTGLVVVGAVGSDLRAEYTAMGDAVNLASRLQTAAPPGGVLITHDTYRQVQGNFEVALQPPLRVKGYSDPVQTYLVKGVKPLAFFVGNRGVEGIATRMVGRDRELSALKDAYAGVAEKHGTRVVTVLGEAGIGKSRLLNEFLCWADARPEHPSCWRGRATRATQLAPYALLRDLFVRHFGIVDTDTAEQALSRFRQSMHGILEQDQADLAGHLAGFDFSSSPVVRALLGTPAFGQIAAASLRQALRAFWQLGPEGTDPRLSSAAPGTPGPVLLLVEDLHWADEASLDLIAGLVGEAQAAERQGQLLLVAAARPEFLERRPRWGERLKGHTRIDLLPLSPRSSRALVRDILQRLPEVPENLREMLVANAEGNPFYLEELVKMLIEDGAIEPGAGPWRINGEKLGLVRLPPTLTAVLQARLDALPADERIVLQRASVIGKQFWDSLVAELAPDGADARRELAALESRELVFRYEQLAFVGVREYTFKHAILQQVTYETVLLQVRRACHAQVARWLEARAGERLDEYLTLIAEHHSLAGQPRVAASWYIRAGERAANLGANGDARRFFETALGLLPPDDLEQRWCALLAHDEVLGVLGDTDARLADDAALLALAEQMGDDSRLAIAHYHRGHYLGVLSRYADAVEALDVALAAAERAGDLVVRADVLSVKVLNLVKQGRMAEAGATAPIALACAEELGQPSTLARTLTNVSIYFAAAGDLARAARLIARQAAIMQEAGNLFLQAASLGNLGYYYLMLGRYPQAGETLEQALTLTEVIGARRERLYNQLNLGLACWRVGDRVRARRLLQEAVPELDAVGDVYGRASGQVYLGLVLQSSGELVAAEAILAEAKRTMEAIGVRGSVADASAGLLCCHLAQGDLQAIRTAAAAVWSFLEEGVTGMEFRLLAYEACARAFDVVGERDRSSAATAAAYSALMDQAGRISDPEWRQSFLRDIAEHQALLERQATARLARAQA